MSDNQPGRKVGCRVCAHALDPVLPRQGQYTHPTCDPEDYPRAEAKAGAHYLVDLRTYDLIDLFGNVRSDP